MPPARPMHANQIEVSATTVARLVSEQFPAWAGMPVRPVRSHGTVNAIFRIGPDLVARLPLEGGTDASDVDSGDVGASDVQAGAVQARRVELLSEMDAARRLLTVSPLAVPEPVALGEPGAGYPLPWSVYRWVPGIPAAETDAADSPQVAEQLAGFVRAVRSLPTEGRTFHGTRRGGLLTEHDEYVRRSQDLSSGLIDTVALATLWGRLRSTPRTDLDAWTHGDLMPGNLLVDEDDPTAATGPAAQPALTGVIDVGQLAVADPALDLQPAWNLFTPAARDAYRQALGSNDEEWDRGRGWALAQAVGCLWYYRETNPVMSRTAHRTLQALLDDLSRG
ncbi:aminoglycoside phosphotransferase (APT) family kinase protein [Humibacillus xanthopallidus]|uniref:Aminoglycoside phosphotransferase (APT) family kinase protein n=1 Tax=Humibacillus xanthopallidus TaxID=412689 RepID=A0A543PPF7_9MICO|nr:aminoglycoside phosphotransferase family protein [Humibacillus xanthopallidus]TQN45927.1 aminoglycoside phosphotransferase (APT) family kinase protein [Humibacillus xanthopallidus]